MSLPVKIAIGTLGGGTVAVSGYEAVSYATGKPGLLFDHSVSQQSGEDRSNSPEASPETNEEEKVSSWIKKTDGFKDEGKKCVLKIYSSSGNQDVSDDNQAEILNFLKTSGSSVTSACVSSTLTENPKEIVLKKDSTSGSWSVMSEKEQVKEIIGKDSFKCEIKFKTSSTTPDFKTLEQANEEEVKGLLSKIKELSTSGCNVQETDKILKVFDKSTGTWQESDEKTRVQVLIKDWLGCGIKVLVDDSIQDISAVENSKLGGLFDSIKSQKESCGSSQNPKKIVVFKKADSGTSWVALGDKEKVDAWIKKTAGFKDGDKKCVLKIFDKSGSHKDISDNGVDLGGLYAYLTTTDSISKSSCSTSGTVGSPDEVVLIKDNTSGWKVLSEGEQIKELLKDTNSFKCAVNIKTSSTATSTKVDQNTSNDELNGLWKALKTEISGCSTANTLTFDKTSGNWTKT